MTSTGDKPQKLLSGIFFYMLWYSIRTRNQGGIIWIGKC